MSVKSCSRRSINLRARTPTSRCATSPAVDSGTIPNKRNGRFAIRRSLARNRATAAGVPAASTRIRGLGSRRRPIGAIVRSNRKIRSPLIRNFGGPSRRPNERPSNRPIEGPSSRLSGSHSPQQSESRSRGRNENRSHRPTENRSSRPRESRGSTTEGISQRAAAHSKRKIAGLSVNDPIVRNGKPKRTTDLPPIRENAGNLELMRALESALGPGADRLNGSRVEGRQLLLVLILERRSCRRTACGQRLALPQAKVSGPACLSCLDRARIHGCQPLSGSTRRGVVVSVGVSSADTR